MGQKILRYLFLLSLMTGSSFSALKVGVTAGPHGMIMDKVKAEAKKQGLDIDVVEFSDFMLPNIALEQGDLDANSFQHQLYLDEQVKTKGYKLISIGKTVLMPMGVYVKDGGIKSITDLPEKAKVGIPNDPSNGARALKLLQTAGLIKLKDVPTPCILDVTENSKNIQIVELEAPQLLRSIDDLDCAITNTDWVILSKKDPQKAIFQETKESPYANVIVVQEKRQDDSEVKKFIEVYHSQPVKDYILSEFKGAVLPAW